MKVGDREEFLTALCQPRLGIGAMALGTTPVAAGVVDIMLLATVITLEQVPAQGLRPAVDDIVHGATMAGQEILAEPFSIVCPLAPQDVRHLWHVRAPV